MISYLDSAFKTTEPFCRHPVLGAFAGYGASKLNFIPLTPNQALLTGASLSILTMIHRQAHKIGNPSQTSPDSSTQPSTDLPQNVRRVNLSAVALHHIRNPEVWVTDLARSRLLQNIVILTVASFAVPYITGTNFVGSAILNIAVLLSETLIDLAYSPDTDCYEKFLHLQNWNLLCSSLYYRHKFCRF
jgi:hypothetical protein